ncbi:secreted RxLR effector protein 161-like [Nicotiana tabacum]|uniref:Secreted RxLR effector protein 161-like n=1 Tax=Nicotiana tabacum TaxID=4097 RepID=A0AC58TG98_TOBAC
MYRDIIGSLLYLTASRPDIVFSVGHCVRFQSNPKESHLKAAKRILRYLKGTQDLVLYYPSGDNFDLIGYADTDYAGYLDTRKQNSMALSTVEAKCVAAASCCAQLLWIKQQLEDFGVFSDCVPLLCDKYQCSQHGQESSSIYENKAH